MKNRWICLVVGAVLCLSGCDSKSSDTEVGSGQPETRTYELDQEFHKVWLGIGDLTIVEGDRNELAITADDNLHEYLEYEIDDDQLTVDRVEGSSLTRKGSNIVVVNNNGSGSRRITIHGGTGVEIVTPIQVTLTLKDLSGIDELYNDGVGNISAPTIGSDEVTLTVSGVGSIQVEKVDIEKLGAGIYGVGSITVGGETHSQDVKVEGTGSYRGFNLKSEVAEVNLSGVGSAQLYVTESVSGELTGVGGIRLKGNPKEVDVDVSGVGGVRRVD